MNDKQNTSHAVMAQRKEPAGSLDDFPTQPWGTRALIQGVLHERSNEFSKLKQMSCWEPSANRGYMVRPLTEYFGRVHASDVHDYGCGYGVKDFLDLRHHVGFNDIDWIITNPPFKLAEEFIYRALECARVGVAVLVRTQFLESIGRYERLYINNPPHVVAQFSERLPLVRGRVDKKASSATAYAWFVWYQGEGGHPLDGSQLRWIPPYRNEWTKPGDYEDYSI